MADKEYETETLARFIARNGLSMTATDKGYAGFGWTSAHHKYACTIRSGQGGETIRVDFHMNPTANGKTLPDLAEVLNAMALDASGFLNARDLADFMAEYGDTDKRSAARTYNACRKEAADLLRLLGQEERERLLYHTESL